MRTTTRALAAALLLAVLAPTALSATSLGLLLANVWSFSVQSTTLLADRGYELEYLFEFVDEEELHVRGAEKSEILDGRIRTILDGDPVEATVLLRGESLPLHIARDGDRLIAAWQSDGRLAAADLPTAEIERRWTLLLTLLQETRRRLGLDGFAPSRDVVVQLPVQSVDVLALVPAKRTPQRYEIRRPGQPSATEYLVTEVGGKRWEVTYGGWELRVRTSPPLDPDHTLLALRYRRGRTTLDAQDAPRSAQEVDRVVSKAFSFLQSARDYFGTAPITAALPRRIPPR